MDEKGLAAIFVFGLPSSWHGNLALRCLQASLEITKVMDDEGVVGHAGIDYGPCYCGLVGDSSSRCEYTVMGGESRVAAKPQASPAASSPWVIHSASLSSSYCYIDSARTTCRHSSLIFESKVPSCCTGPQMRSTLLPGLRGKRGKDARASCARKPSGRR